MFSIPNWLVLAFWVVPVLTIVVLVSTLVISYFHSLYYMYKTNKYMNKFSEWSQADNCSVTVAMLISFFCTTAGLLAGVPVNHPAVVLWYCITNVMCLLYWVFVIDYYILKYKGMIG